ncbi:leishmanolysin-related zinc metalloendopeptidase [Hasllibacter sp. MH4015]|uniref:leishmanolysin-related zinc metalloendopeptidase n=1 Tax=Hasllibacter sp. MH4015 TaxID=2854029 RepID=UPI001CD21C23|nr:leishmanolysin-related zinc metalloendopeptidase [Hasllibacter sp. MH4015]
MIHLTYATDLSDARRTVFDAAAARWNEVLITDFPEVDLNGTPETGVLIEVSVTDIDGPEGVLGQAGPTHLRPDTRLPARGVMEFDAADLERLELQGSFQDVILHEMAHVLGFGTLWGMFGLIAGSGTMNPEFTGPRAIGEYRALVGSDAAIGVPIANTGGPGTREGHWRELVFGDELLTGFLSGTDRPLSRLSLAAFEDLGYGVDYARADTYALPDFRDLAIMGITEAVRICDLCRMLRPEPVILYERRGAPGYR